MEQRPVELSILAGRRRVVARPDFLITVADTAAEHTAYRAMRHHEFVDRQGLFAHSDLDDTDDDPRTVVLVATLADGTIAGGVRVAPVRWDGASDTEDIGWWFGSRLVVADPGHAHVEPGPAEELGERKAERLC